VVRGNEGDRMPVRFRYLRTEESDSQRRKARQRRPGRWRLRCCPRKGMTPGGLAGPKMGRELGRH
jgi:hypothetical protein